MSSERTATGAPPDTTHPVRKLARGAFYEVISPSKDRIAALRQAASRFGKRLNRLYKVEKSMDDKARVVVRVYRIK